MSKVDCTFHLGKSPSPVIQRRRKRPMLVRQEVPAELNRDSKSSSEEEIYKNAQRPLNKGFELWSDCSVQNVTKRLKCDGYGLTNEGNAGQKVQEIQRTPAFSTANGKRILVSDSALCQAKAVFADADATPHTGGLSPSAFITHENKFSTASGKTILVSNKSLTKAKAMYNQEIAQLKSIPSADNGAPMDKQYRQPFSNHGLMSSGKIFATAGGKSVSVSEKSLAACRSELSDDRHCAEDVCCASSTVSAGKGFSTASGKSINVGPSSLLMARNMFDDCGKDAVGTVFGRAEAAVCSPLTRRKHGEHMRNRRLDFHRSESPISSVSSGGADCDRLTTGYEYSYKTPVLSDCSSLRQICDPARTTSSDLNRDTTTLAIPQPVSNNFPLGNAPCKYAVRSKFNSPCMVGGPAQNDCSKSLVRFKQRRFVPPVLVGTPVPASCSKFVSRRKMTYPEEEVEAEHSVPTISPNPVDGMEDMTSQRIDLAKVNELLTKRRGTRLRPLQEALIGQGPQFYDSDELVNEYGAPNLRINMFDEASEISVGSSSLLDLYKCFVNFPDVRSELISQKWFLNHCKWVTTRLAAMEMAFPHLFGKKIFTPERILCDMKLRYDKEINHSQRSALRKIMEGDAAPGSAMVLFVSKISTSEDGSEKESTEIELSDGWYSIKAQMDAPLKHFVTSGKLRLGYKIFVVRATLIGVEGGCHPFEAPENAFLGLNANCVRRAKWWSRLGFQRLKHPPVFPLVSLIPGGGVLPCTKVLVARVYPIMYWESADVSGGKGSVHNQRKEDILQQKFEARLESALCRAYETAYEVPDAEEDEAHVDPDQLKRTPLRNINSGEELYYLLSRSKDQEQFVQSLSEEQRRAFSNYMSSRHQKVATDRLEAVERCLRNEVSLPKRDVKPILKIRLQGYHKKDRVHSASTILTIWNPPQDLLEQLEEGRCFHLYNVNTRPQRNSNSCHACSCELASRLSDTKYFRFQPQASIMSNLSHPTVCSTFSNIGASSHPFNEVSVMGMVVEVVENGSQAGNQTIHLADLDGAFVAVKTHRHLKELCLDDVLRPGSLWTFLNLKFPCKICDQSLILLYMTEFTEVTARPKIASFRKLMDETLRPKLKGQKLANIIGSCQEKIRNFASHKKYAYSTPSPVRTREQQKKELMSKHSGLVKNYGSAKPLAPQKMIHRASAHLPFRPPGNCRQL